MSSIFTNRISKTAFRGFVDDALSRGMNRQHVAPVGFLTSRITRFLDRKNVRLGHHNIIILESKLVNNKKYRIKHTRMGNAPAIQDWHNLVDWMLDAPVYWDGRGLIYLVKIDSNRYMKIAVAVDLANKTHRGVNIFLPKIDTMYVLDLAGESVRGRDEYQRIVNLPRIK